MIDFNADTVLLIIAPHPDDEVFGCGGLIDKVKSFGGKVFVMFGALGDIRVYNNERSIVTPNIKIDEINKVVKFYDIDGWEVLVEDEHYCLRLDTYPRRDLVDLIEESCNYSLNKLNPQILAIPLPSFNQDHEALYEAAMTACRPPVPNIKYVPPLILAYEYPSIGWALGNYSFSPNFYLDISGSLDKKLEALSYYESGLRCSTYSISVDSAKYFAFVRGREISVDAAEAYEIKRLSI